MKNQRAAVVLEMVFALQEKGHFTEAGIISELRISRSTFFRCLSDLRCYLQERRPFEEIVYDDTKGVYRLEKPI